MQQEKKLGHSKIGTVKVTFDDLVKGKEKVYWEGNGLNKAELRLGVTAVDFGKEDKSPAAADKPGFGVRVSFVLTNELRTLFRKLQTFLQCLQKQKLTDSTWK